MKLFILTLDACPNWLTFKLTLRAAGLDEELDLEYRWVLFVSGVGADSISSIILCDGTTWVLFSTLGQGQTYAILFTNNFAYLMVDNARNIFCVMRAHENGEKWNPGTVEYPITEVSFYHPKGYVAMRPGQKGEEILTPHLNGSDTEYLGENQTFFGDSFLFSFQSKKLERNTSGSFSSHWDRSLV